MTDKYEIVAESHGFILTKTKNFVSELVTTVYPSIRGEYEVIKFKDLNGNFYIRPLFVVEYPLIPEGERVDLEEIVNELLSKVIDLAVDDVIFIVRVTLGKYKEGTVYLAEMVDGNLDFLSTPLKISCLRTNKIGKVVE